MALHSFYMNRNASRPACRSCGSCEPAAPVTVVPGPFVSRSAYNPPVLHLPKNTPEEKG
jgi:hypothetical protein